ncbi:Peroxiredoxin [Filimonas lacunae]|uniref:Peroxiredoxin n=1 Tax=Filimonas lacunae TaxID=477680 RepID=A0A173MCD0_9BACT|nr:TlpA disulfide reductase family protein [Filimonas lacunae]BAV05118.1 thioredoxin family protein [Filimonas lacunae]SIT34203.1 Peroxiredoxin [Filimonas lacunae]
MKKQLLTPLALLPLLVAAQAPNFTVTGKIGHLNAPAKVYFDYMDDGKSKSDSAFVKDGAFRFTGHTSPYSYVRMGLSHDGSGKQRAVYGGDVIYFYMGKEKVKIQSADSLIHATISGSKVNEEYNAYNRFIGGTIMELTKAVNIAFSSGTAAQQKDTAYFQTIDKQYRQNIANRATKQIEFAQQYPNSYFSVIALSEAGGMKGVSSVETLYNNLSEELRNTDPGKELAQRINAAHTIVEGATAPAFTQNNINGQPVTLNSYRGKYVLLEFWASWCSPCRAENPNLRKQYAQYKDKGFEVLGVSLDDDKQKWAQAIEADQLPWTHVSDLKGWNNEVGRLYGIRAVPASFLLNPEGKIIGINLRGETLNNKLATIWPQE